MQAFDPNCIFCKILAKQAPAAIVYESSDTMAFLDINPVPEGHMLIVPKKHFRNLFDFDDASAKGAMHAARVVARAMRKTLGADGMSMVLSSERAGGQEIFHAHFHLFPRYYDDGLTREGRPRQGYTPRRGDSSPEGLNTLAEKIRANLVDD